MKLTTTTTKTIELPPGTADRTYWDDELGGFGLRLRAGGFDRAFILTSFHQSPLPLALLLRDAGVHMLDRSSTTLELAANERLAAKLSVWTQSELTITLRADSEKLALLAIEPAVARHTPIEERSAGLRTRRRCGTGDRDSV